MFDFTDGEYPYAGLVQATGGDFYGTTGAGGVYGLGTAFRISPNGTIKTLYSFCSESGCPDGSEPMGTLVLGSDGNYYGTTYAGGVYNSQSGSTFGTIFRMTSAGALTTLYSFCPSGDICTDGQNPEAGLIQAEDGDFYGTTTLGGAHSAGTVFKISTSGTFTTLYSFCSLRTCIDGSNPNGALIQAANGYFYGTTSQGGAHKSGTVYKITPKGVVTTLHEFCVRAGCADGAHPTAALTQATDGYFYGTTNLGGTSCVDGDGCGTIFKMNLSGVLTTLHNFCNEANCTDGQLPLAALVQATNGDFYGTTGSGGTMNDGIVFSLAVGLGPFVQPRPISGSVGAAVQILGTKLTGVSKVTFNGVAAAFKVVSSSEITTTVPSGTTTGNIQVVTSAGTLTSNVVFRIP